MGTSGDPWGPLAAHGGLGAPTVTYGELQEAYGGIWGLMGIFGHPAP